MECNNVHISSCLELNFPNTIWRTDKLLPTPQLIGPFDKRTICQQVQTKTDLNTLQNYISTGIFLSWFAVPGADRYLVQWSNEPQFTGPSVRERIVDAPITTYELRYGTDVRQDEQIYWRIQAANITTGGVSGKSRTRQFTYSCGDNKQNPTLSDQYAIESRIQGPQHMKCCDKKNFGVVLNWICLPTTDLNYINIKEVFWTYTHLNGKISSKETIADGFSKIILNDANKFEIELNTELQDTQETQLCVNVVFNFPNDLSRGEFTHTKCHKIFNSCALDPYDLVKFILTEDLSQCGESEGNIVLGDSCEVIDQITLVDTTGQAYLNQSDDGQEFAQAGSMGFARKICSAELDGGSNSEESTRPKYEIISLGVGLCCEASSEDSSEESNSDSEDSSESNSESEDCFTLLGIDINLLPVFSASEVTGVLAFKDGCVGIVELTPCEDTTSSSEG